MIKEQGNLTSLEDAAGLAEGYDPQGASVGAELQAVPEAARHLDRRLEQGLQLSPVKATDRS